MRKGLLPLLLVLLTGCPRIVRPANPDVLDSVTGTESWRRTPESISQEWKDWYRARVAMRRDYRELRIQRVRNVLLADLIDRYPDGPGIEEVQRVLRSRATRLPAGAGTGSPGTAAPAPDLQLDGSGQPGPRRRRGKLSRDHGRQPPPWVKVPVERLDSKGQAIDEEGDRELEKSLRKR